MPYSEVPGSIPFAFFCSLLREISEAKLHTPKSPSERTAHPALEILRRWISALHEHFSPIPRGTTVIVFRMLFPEEDTRRKYNMQETALASHLAECFGVNTRTLREWSLESSSGCLGEVLHTALQEICPNADENIGSLSIAQVDDLLDELAANSGYSHISIRAKYPQSVRRRRLPVLQALYHSLPPIEASFLTQIILKDLRPLLYPMQEHHFTAALKHFDTTCVRMLTKQHAMRAWDPSGSMLKIYRVRSTLDDAATGFEQPLGEREAIVPCLGTPVEIPKSEKGRGCCHALGFFRHSRKIWAEVKYDGERAQIHVEILHDRTSRITIFSKSKRDSTLDRLAIHEVIRQTLGLSISEQPVRRVAKVTMNVILDAEMVAFHGNHIDEFWRIRGLIGQTAYGIRGTNYGKDAKSLPSSCSQSSMITDISNSRHLGLVFFDVLTLDHTSLLSTPYSQRRDILESLIQPIPGLSMLSERTPIDMRPTRSEESSDDLARIFSRTIGNHQEGIVLKADESQYHDYRLPWVKLKKDYIPGHGDTLDLVVVGAGWDKGRARELRVPPTTFTTLYIGALANATETKRNPSLQTHLEVYFTVSYGLNRAQLEEINFLIRSSDPLLYGSSPPTEALMYTFTLLSGLQPPTVILRTPLLAELCGAGFDKAPKSKQNYQLRFPRVTKIYRTGERSWRDGLNLQEIHKIACSAIGRDISDKAVNDWCNELWGKPVSPGGGSSLKRKATSDAWEEKLLAFDGRATRRIGISNAALPNRRTQDVVPCLAFVRPKFGPQPLTIRTNSCESMPEADSRTSFMGPHRKKLCSPTHFSSNDDIIVPGSIQQTRAGHALSLDVAALPGMKFLENSLVWFAMPRSQLAYWPWKSSIPRRQRLHTVESLLTGCGWHADPCNGIWVGRGVVFVHDNDEAGREWKAYALKIIEERRVGLNHGRGRRPIWIFDCGTWEFEREDVEGQALHRFS